MIRLSSTTIWIEYSETFAIFR